MAGLPVAPPGPVLRSLHGTHSRLRVALLGLALAWASPQAAQELPARREDFLQSNRIWEIHLHLTPADWKSMEPAQNPPRTGGREQAPPQQGRPNGPQGFNPNDRPPGGMGPGMGMMPQGGFDFPWVSGLVEVNGTVFTNVGVRFKGNSSFNGSRQSRKRPFKLDFDRHVPGRTLAGLEEIFLNNNANDPSQLRETMAYAAFNRAGIPAPHTTYARLWLTLAGETEREYVGLYTVVEPVEGDFLKQRLGTKKGLLVKPERVRGLEYLGTDWFAYTNRYEPRSKVRAADTDRFVSILREFNQGDDATFKAAVSKSLEIDSLLKFVAVTAWLANYDSLLGTGHNYYLFLGSDDGRLRFIPWDLNEAFGRHPGAGGSQAQAEFSILQPYTTPNRFLDRVFAQPEWAARYKAIVGELQTGACSTNLLQRDYQQLQATLKSALASEPANGPRMGGPQMGGPGGMGRSFGNLAVSDWVQIRQARVKADLEGTLRPQRPQMRMGPAGGGGPGGRRPFGPDQ